MCRTLGLPARSLCNYVSAHDTDASLSIDRFFDKNNEAIKGVGDDSIWNFHCWVECWMSRKDLKPGYGGWQVIDGTPQETSGGY